MDKCLNLWSAACSSGQEAYSIAMILQEFQGALVNWNVRLLATDLSTAMLDRARAGIFSEVEVNRGLLPSRLARHFRKHGKNWQIKDELRCYVQFLRINLIEPLPSVPPMDVVFLRNVLIYLDAEAKKRVLANVRRCLRPGGYLFLGGAETTLNIDDAFERVQLDKVSCYCLGERRLFSGGRPCQSSH
jgi:chemotaxis protein methyltransferase CheR